MVDHGAGDGNLRGEGVLQVVLVAGQLTERAGDAGPVAAVGRLLAAAEQPGLGVLGGRQRGVPAVQL
jgi:hypothetical protein